MESMQALLAAHAADAIVGFLHRVHTQERTTVVGPQLEYNTNEDFNSYIDEANEQVQIFELTYRASEVLFMVDRQAYRELLADYEPEGPEPGVVPGSG
jgi:hypothetical protein